MKEGLVWRLAHVVTLLCATYGTALATDIEAEDSGLSYDDKLQSCTACHGENGDKPLAPDYPILAGQYPSYLEVALKAYRSGRRDHPIMKMQVEALGLTDSDISRLAAHFGSKAGLQTLAK